MSASLSNRPTQEDVQRRCAEGWPVDAVMAEFDLPRADVMDQAFRGQLRYNQARDAFDVTLNTHLHLRQHVQSLGPNGHLPAVPAGPPTPAPGAVPTDLPAEAVQPEAAYDVDGTAPAGSPTTGAPDGMAAARAKSTELRNAARQLMVDLGIDSKTLRAWCRDHNVPCSTHGQVNVSAIDAYAEWVAAGRPDPTPKLEIAPPIRIELHTSQPTKLLEPEPVAMGIGCWPPIEDAEPEHHRYVAVAMSAPPQLLSAILAAATTAGDFTRTTVEDGWLYLEAVAQ